MKRVKQPVSTEQIVHNVFNSLKKSQGEREFRSSKGSNEITITCGPNKNLGFP